MRLLIVSDAWEPQINGVVRVYQNLARELRAAGHEVIVIGPDRFASMPMPGYREISLSWPRGLTRMIDEITPDSIHIAVEGPLGWAARRYCLKRGKPFSTFFHTQFPDYVAARMGWSGKRVTHAVRRMAINATRAFHAPAHATYVTTASVENQLRAWGFREPLVRLACGVDFSIFHPAPRTLFSNLARPVHLYVGRVATEKNLDAFLSLHLTGSKVVVGSGPALDTLRKKYPDAVFTGAKTGRELGDHFRSADVFVFPSKTDTFGMVVAEALACGIPVAAYDVTGPRDIITEPDFGAVDNDLSRAIARALASGGTADTRFAAMRARYDWPAIARLFLQTETPVP